MATRLTVMTYNVRSCVGKDGKVSPSRISMIIAHYNPDVVALQELDVRLPRSGMTDQAQLIARDLEMGYTFFPALRLEKGEYGNAILSRYPMQMVKAEELPTHPARADLEKRGALWAKIDLSGLEVQIITTHLGLNRIERRLQADTLMGAGWLDHPECCPPAIVCGDLNSHPGSSVYRKFAGTLRDAQVSLDGYRPRSTWPTRLPLRRIDHLLVTRDVVVEWVTVPRNSLIAEASDHLPLVVKLRFPAAGKRGAIACPQS